MRVNQKIVEVQLCTDEGVGFAIVELANGKFAYIWGNIPWDAGQMLRRDVEDNTDEKGVILADTFDVALSEWTGNADALSNGGRSDARTAVRMLELALGAAPQGEEGWKAIEYMLWDAKKRAKEDE